MCASCHWLILLLIFTFTLSSSLYVVVLQRNSAGSENPSDVFRFLVEERVQCCQTRRVRYTQRVDYCIQLPAPIEAATNRGKRPPIHMHTHTHTMLCCSRKPQLPLVGTAGTTLSSGGTSCWENQQVALWKGTEGPGLPDWGLSSLEWGRTCLSPKMTLYGLVSLL